MVRRELLKDYLSIRVLRNHLSCVIFFFFFSSRRRHTRFDCDWSSDVCSSDLHWTRPAWSRTTRRAVAVATPRPISTRGTSTCLAGGGKDACGRSAIAPIPVRDRKSVV